MDWDLDMSDKTWCIIVKYGKLHLSVFDKKI